MQREGYNIRVSTHKNKKYDVLDAEGRIITRFGARDMEHYFDKLGAFSHLDHKDEKRLEAFKRRFSKLIDKYQNDKTSAMYWSSKYLW
jgi:hypothetical protein